MDVLEPVCGVLSTVAGAIHDYQKNRNAITNWEPEERFCSGLESSLESIIACSPIDENFEYDQELNLLIRAVLEPLLSFCNALTPRLASLQRGAGAHDSKKALAHMLRDSVIPHVNTLREQVHKYLEGINTLLLIYIIDVLSSEPLEVIWEQQLAELHSIKQQIHGMAVRDSEQQMAFFSKKKLSIAEQQKFLMSMRQDAEHYWSTVQMTTHGDWSNAANNSDDSLKPLSENRTTVRSGRLEANEVRKERHTYSHIDVRHSTSHTLSQTPVHHGIASLSSSSRSNIHDVSANHGPNVPSTGSQPLSVSRHQAVPASTAPSNPIELGSIPKPAITMAQRQSIPTSSREAHHQQSDHAGDDCSCCIIM